MMSLPIFLWRRTKKLKLQVEWVLLDFKLKNMNSMENESVGIDDKNDESPVVT